MSTVAPITIRNAWICQIVGNRVVPFYGDLHIADQHIVTIAPVGKSKQAGAVLDAAGRVVTIPLVNFHEHCYSRLSKGLTVSGPTNNFLHILENLWWKLDRALDHDMIRASAQLTALESITNGVTYLFDHHASPNCIEGSLSIIADVLCEFYLCGVLCYEVTDRNGAEKARAGLSENRDFIEETASRNVCGVIGLHAPFTLSDKTLLAACNLRRSLDCAIHVHISEDMHERELSLKQYGISPARRLNKFLLLTSESILAHGVYLTDEEHQIIAESGAAIACCPDSNFNNGVGIPYYGDIPTGIPLLTGTDGMHANVARTLKQMFLIFRQQGNSFKETFAWIQKIYFDQIQFTRRYFPDYPSLVEGNRADLIIWDYVPPSPISEYNFFGHYVYGILESRIHSVIMNGQYLMRAFELTATDIHSKRAEISKQGAWLHRKLAEINVIEPR